MKGSFTFCFGSSNGVSSSLDPDSLKFTFSSLFSEGGTDATSSGIGSRIIEELGLTGRDTSSDEMSKGVNCGTGVDAREEIIDERPL